MSELSLLALAVLTTGSLPTPSTAPPAPQPRSPMPPEKVAREPGAAWQRNPNQTSTHPKAKNRHPSLAPETKLSPTKFTETGSTSSGLMGIESTGIESTRAERDRIPEFSAASAPRSGAQLYLQRLAALKSGRLYTRLPIDSFREFWQQATDRPTHEQWRRLLRLEARAVGRGQGANRLAVMVGDSLSLWFPCDRLSSDQLWLNQGLSGDTTRGILQRLGDFAQTRPQTIYVMAGVNDLKQGRSDREILWNMRQIVRRLRQTHPQAQIVLQSILPTRSALISYQRIARLNQAMTWIAQRDGAVYLDVYSHLVDTDGQLQSPYTTDGIHLNSRGYATWQMALQQVDRQLAQRP